MTNETAAIAARIRKILAGRRGITEKPMFGGVCFLRRRHMLCGAGRQGFMFRVGRAQHARAVIRRGARGLGAGSYWRITTSRRYRQKPKSLRPEPNSGSGSQLVYAYAKMICDPDPEFGSVLGPSPN